MRRTYSVAKTALTGPRFCHFPHELLPPSLPSRASVKTRFCRQSAIATSEPFRTAPPRFSTRLSEPFRAYPKQSEVIRSNPNQKKICAATSDRALHDPCPSRSPSFVIRLPAIALAAAGHWSFVILIVLTALCGCAAPKAKQPAQAIPPPVLPAKPKHPLWTYAFTNELGQPVTLESLQGHVLAITFFFTRCPNPNFCPQLSKNFQQTQKEMLARKATNWRLLSVTIDPGYDTPAVLRNYGRRYGYDPRYWSFWTGPADKIGELARLSDVTYEGAGVALNHNFRTLIIDHKGALQAAFPTGGDISSSIVAEMQKAIDARGPSTDGGAFVPEALKP